MQQDVVLKIGKRTFFTAVIILGLLMLTVGVLTLVIPAGHYDRIEQGGREVLLPGSFHFVDQPDFPVWRWLTAPLEVLGSEDGPMIIVIIVFVLAIAGSVTLLEKSQVLARIISGIVRRFMDRKYVLMGLIVFLFMAMGAFLGTFEENVALVPIVIALAYTLKWDSLVGLGMSLLASCFGFTAAITNPFSIAITQSIADLPLYSGSAYRVLIFFVYYALLMSFLVRYAKRIERNPERSLVYGDDTVIRAKYASAEALSGALEQKTQAERDQLDRAIKLFGFYLIGILILVVAASFVEFLSSLLLPLIGLSFFLASVAAARLSGQSGKTILRTLGASYLAISPGFVLILMAMSVKYIIDQGGIMDTILYYAAEFIAGRSPYLTVLLVYLLILLLELFVGSSSAKAFLLMPLIAPLAELVGITRQVAVLAFSFGDGFSNVLYPTNPVLLICLGLTVVTYPKWFRWTYKLQLAAFALACLFLVIGVAFHYGPF